MNDDLPDPNTMVDLGDLLGRAADAIIKTQDSLDERALRQKTIFEQAPAGEIALPPLWFTMSNVVVEIEMSAAVGKGTASLSGQSHPVDSGVRFMCRTVSPAMVGLYGYQASAGMRVSLQIGPGGILPIKQDSQAAFTDSPTPGNRSNSNDKCESSPFHTPGEDYVQKTGKK